MMSPTTRPPAIADWLVGMFTPDKNTDAMQGDLAEEFAELASESGVASARRWYWRQSMTSVAHLIAIGFRVAPLLIAGAVLGGCLLLWFGLGLPERAILGGLHIYRSYFGIAKTLALWKFWVPWGIQTGRVLVAMLVGCLIALTAKRREMVAAMALSAVCATLGGIVYPVWAFWHFPEYAFLVPRMIIPLIGSIAILVGAGVVREIRFTSKCQP
jgi:hypothetical protein